MKRCAYCDSIIVAGGHGEGGDFCSRKCETRQRKLQDGFCERCLAQTIEESPGTVYSLNGIGTMLMGSRWRVKGKEECLDCGSVIQHKWMTFGIGIAPLGTYRILYLRQGLMESDFLGRRLRDDPLLPEEPSPQPERAPEADRSRV